MSEKAFSHPKTKKLFKGRDALMQLQESNGSAFGWESQYGFAKGEDVLVMDNENKATLASYKLKALGPKILVLDNNSDTTCQWVYTDLEQWVREMRLLAPVPSPLVQKNVVPKAKASLSAMQVHDVGLRLTKEFQTGTYSGRISSYDPQEQYYRIVYDDGDEEDMSETEVGEHLNAGRIASSQKQAQKVKAHKVDAGQPRRQSIKRKREMNLSETNALLESTREEVAKLTKKVTLLTQTVENLHAELRNFKQPHPQQSMNVPRLTFGSD
jgi:hypothetical protein